MREILFRGKDPETENWYEGQYIHLHKTTYCFAEDYDNLSDNDIHQIVFERMTDWGLPNQYYRVDVDPSTVGQYTGLKDKNGVRIFEGDIVTFCGITGFVNFNMGCFCIKTNKPDWRARNNPAIDIVFNEYENEVCVISNIHDNPELLKEETS